MMKPLPIESVDQPELALLRKQLMERSPDSGADQKWISAQLGLCAEFGVFRWFAPQDLGGFGWSETDIVRGYLALSSGCLTTTFVITQWTAAVKRILASDNHDLTRRLIPDFLNGKRFITVGISHLTTSRQHLGRPILAARPADQGDGFVLDGFSPWVTGAQLSDHIVVGATLSDGQQILLTMSTDCSGVEIGTPHSLIALSASLTGSVRCQNVFVPAENLVAGPATQVLAGSSAARTGGPQTTTLALGLAKSAIDYLAEQMVKRPQLADTHQSLFDNWQELVAHLIEATSGSPTMPADELRSRANSLVLRGTQAALVAAKGTGFVSGHPVGRWCQEALFFLVWSCPQAVQDANLCELANATFDS